MAAVLRKNSRTRSSKRYCKEKFCCKTENTEAFYHCEDCGTDQCCECDETIHKISVKFEFHDRRKLDPTPSEELCQIDKVQNLLVCEEENYADLRCEVCALNFCFSCFDDYHKGNRKTHRKTFFKEFRQRQLQKQLNNPLKPSSPLQSDDDSLTYMSCPQLLDQVIDIDLQLTEHLEAQPADTTQTESMNSFSSAQSDHSQHSSIPDICLSAGNEMSSLEAQLAESIIDLNDPYDNVKSFMLINDQEVIQIGDEDEFIEKLGCDSNEHVKVVSIFGNTGDGKSFTLNHTFFGGKEVFKTSSHQSSCTVGVWAAFDPKEKVIVIDTEGLLGITSNQNQRMRLLLKILGISDIIIYRTRAERLHNDMYQFLCESSSAYTKHFSDELEATAKRCNKGVGDLTPAVIIFQETVNTNVLGSSGTDSAEKFIWNTFRQLECPMHFKDLTYVGVRTGRPPTDFTQFQRTMSQHLQDKSNRAARRPAIVYKTLKNLNDKFNGEVEKPLYGTFPDQLFSCSMKCLSCGEGCTRSMNHNTDNKPHETDKRCKYQHQFENKVFLCKSCYLSGKEHVVIPKTSESRDSAWSGLIKYVWAGEVLECPSCGVIFRSRQNWYGNKEVEEIVHTEIRHVWPDGYKMLQGTNNAARKVIDGFHYIADSITSVGSKPTKMISDWMNDRIAPEYWVPNSQISHCHQCSKELETEQKHHCRACGKGFCGDCSSHRRRVPERGWGEMEVRVCDKCYGGKKMSDSNDSTGSNSQVTARKVGEVVTSAISVAASTLNYPIDMIKDTARPAYWTPDEQIKACYVCEELFGPKLRIHHCRACGQGVCESCSPNKRPVPLRGWDYPVRICRKCVNKPDRL